MQRASCCGGCFQSTSLPTAWNPGLSRPPRGERGTVLGKRSVVAAACAQKACSVPSWHVTEAVDRSEGRAGKYAGSMHLRTCASAIGARGKSAWSTAWRGDGAAERRRPLACRQAVGTLERPRRVVLGSLAHVAVFMGLKAAEMCTLRAAGPLHVRAALTEEPWRPPAPQSSRRTHRTT